MSTTFKTLKTTKVKVKYLLTAFPHLRDSDDKLIASYWYYEKGEEVIQNISAMELLHMFASGGLTSTESIRRVRQKLQELHPELRGENYNKRQEAEVEIRKNINTL